MVIFANAIQELAALESDSASTHEDLARILAGVDVGLRGVIETLSVLGHEAEGQRFDSALDELLNAIATRVAAFVQVHSLDVFRYDRERYELFAVRRSPNGRTLEKRFRVEDGLVADVLATNRPVNLTIDPDDGSAGNKLGGLGDGFEAQRHAVLLVPLASGSGEVLGLVCALDGIPDDAQRLATPQSPGFGPEIEETIGSVVVVLGELLECSGIVAAAIQKQRAVTALMHATNAISRCSLNLEETLRSVMDEAKGLMNADRSTLWLLDHETEELWTTLPTGTEHREIRIPMNAGFAGLVAESGDPVNIAFDLYTHPNASTAKRVDQQTGYRTCSLLCMPVHNADGDLIGVTQLVNKIRPGGVDPYDPSRWPEPPDCWKASFTHADQEYMESFNQQAGVALQNAKLFATIKQQEQMQRDILRHLTNGVLSTDDEGRIVAFNESALELLGLPSDSSIQGRHVGELVKLEDGDFATRLEAALSAPDDKARQQYYPEQALLAGEVVRSVNLSISSMSDAVDSAEIRGALIVMDDISDEKRLKSTMYRYMTQALAEQLLQGGDTIRLGGDRKIVSVLFSDIRSYTTLTEKMEPEEVVSFLNEYFESMVETVFNHSGTLDKFIGDAIMAVYGSPLAIDDHAWCAVQSAMEMRHRLREFNARRRASGLAGIEIGIGINSDEVVSGNIGTSKRMEFTAIGDGINLGSRLEGISKVYGCDIVISGETFRYCGDRVTCRELDAIQVKGKSEPVAIFELLELNEGPLAQPITEARRLQMEHYHAGRSLYMLRKFAEAIGEFEKALKATPEDKASKALIARSRNFAANPPPDEWDGVWMHTEK